MTTGQLLLQSFYEDQDRAMRLGGLHHTSLSGLQLLLIHWPAAYQHPLRIPADSPLHSWLGVT